MTYGQGIQKQTLYYSSVASSIAINKIKKCTNILILQFHFYHILLI